MPRSKSTVQESIEFLQGLEVSHKGSPQEVRVRMLRLLKENPSHTLSQVSQIIACSERSVQRWWEIYNKKGIDAVLDIQKRGRKKGVLVSDTILNAFRDKLRVDGFDELKDAQQWLRETHGIEYSRSSVWKLLRAERAQSGRWTTAVPSNVLPSAAVHLPQPASGLHVPIRFIEFLNSLPVTGEAGEWMETFKKSLQSLFDDVDRVSLNLDRHCNLDDPKSYKPNIFVTEHLPNESDGDGTVIVENIGTEPEVRLLNNFRRQGLKLDVFHPPTFFNYYYEGTAYLATIFLWREAHKPPISEETISLVNALQPFLISIMSGVVARNQKSRPQDAVFKKSLEFMADEAGLTVQEKRIVTLQLLGNSYQEIADTLFISIDGVKKHFKQIHRKTNTRGHAELFAKYFTNRYALRDGERAEE
jgi:DNA-binding CsgD family transcriptional regulator